MCGCLLHAPTGDLVRNPGMCPDWESNPQAFGSLPGAQSTELHQPGPATDINIPNDIIVGVSFLPPLSSSQWLIYYCLVTQVLRSKGREG